MMTALPTLTQDAQSALDRYLGRVKSALRPHSSVDAEEVERDIRGHIEAELEAAPAPVTAERLGNVLDRLGSPNVWVCQRSFKIPPPTVIENSPTPG